MFCWNCWISFKISSTTCFFFIGFYGIVNKVKKFKEKMALIEMGDKAQAATGIGLSILFSFFVLFPWPFLNYVSFSAMSYLQNVPLMGSRLNILVSDRCQTLILTPEELESNVGKDFTTKYNVKLQRFRPDQWSAHGLIAPSTKLFVANLPWVLIVFVHFVSVWSYFMVLSFFSLKPILVWWKDKRGVQKGRV